MSRFTANSMVIERVPCVLTKLIVLSPAMVENCYSNGSATDEATVSGLAPGKEADTEMTGVL